jgi:hypothetical protein
MEQPKSPFKAGRFHVSFFGSQGSRRNNFAFWRESRWSIMNRFLLAAHTQDRAPSGCPQARWRGASDDAYSGRYVRSEQQSQRAWGPAAECELISARTLSVLVIGLPRWPCRVTFVGSA